MRFSSHLVDIANAFRQENLESNDKRDDTRMAEKWENFPVLNFFEVPKFYSAGPTSVQSLSKVIKKL